MGLRMNQEALPMIVHTVSISMVVATAPVDSTEFDIPEKLTSLIKPLCLSHTTTPKNECTTTYTKPTHPARQKRLPCKNPEYIAHIKDQDWNNHENRAEYKYSDLNLIGQKKATQEVR
jgi:hypothetical protein